MAMEIEIDTRQAERAAELLARAPRGFDIYILDALRESAKDVAGLTRRLLRKKKSPSPAGIPPGRRTGTLAKSIRFRQVRRRKEGGALAYVVFHTRDAFYGKFLETGTVERSTYIRATLFKAVIGTVKHRKGRVRRIGKGVSRGTLEKRPFLTAARDARAPETSARVAAAIERTLREASAR